MFEGKPPPVRVSWTYPTINASRQTGIVATGQAKADAVAKTLADDFESDDASELALAVTPARGVNGKYKTRLIIDFAAN